IGAHIQISRHEVSLPSDARLASAGATPVATPDGRCRRRWPSGPVYGASSSPVNPAAIGGGNRERWGGVHVYSQRGRQGRGALLGGACGRLLPRRGGRAWTTPFSWLIAEDSHANRRFARWRECLCLGCAVRRAPGWDEERRGGAGARRLA